PIQSPPNRSRRRGSAQPWARRDVTVGARIIPPVVQRRSFQEGPMHRTSRFVTILATFALLALAATPAITGGSPTSGVVPRATQTNAQYESSGSAVVAVSATTERVSCYRPLVPYVGSDGPNDGYTGQSVCPARTPGETTGEDLGPYPTQFGANPEY